MPEQRTRWWNYPLALIVLGGLGAAVFYGVRLGWRSFIGLPSDTAKAFVVAATTIVTSVLALLVSRYFERRRALDEQHRLRKIPIYEDFMRYWFSLLLSDETHPAPTPEETHDFLAGFTQQLIVWGSDRVLKEWSGLMRKFREIDDPENVSPDLMFSFERMLLTLRRDLGHRNKGLERKDLLRLFTTDVDALFGDPGATR